MYSHQWLVHHLSHRDALHWHCTNETLSAHLIEPELIISYTLFNIQHFFYILTNSFALFRNQTWLLLLSTQHTKHKNSIRLLVQIHSSGKSEPLMMQQFTYGNPAFEFFWLYLSISTTKQKARCSSCKVSEVSWVMFVELNLQIGGYRVLSFCNRVRG